MTHALPSALPTLATLGFRWTPLATERGPFGSVVWLEVGPTAPLPSAARSPGVSFHETGVVARLRVRNTTLRPVLVPSDLVVDGGKQARVVEASIVLPPDAEVEVPVRCVERGRWHAKSGGRPTDDFEIRGAMSSRTRSTFARNKSERHTETGRYELDQRTVWGHVREELVRTQVVSSTQSYADFIDDGRAKVVREARAMTQRAPARANGLLVTHASGSAWVEVLPSRADLCVVADYVVADLFDATSVRNGARVGEPRGDLLDRAWRSALSPIRMPPLAMGTAFALGSEEVVGSVLAFEGQLAHVGISNVASG